MRPTHGVSMQSTYTWSKNLGISEPSAAPIPNPADRHADYAPLPDHPHPRLPDQRNVRAADRAEQTVARQQFRSPGTNPRGLADGLDREPEQRSANEHLAAQNMLYANGTPDIVGPFDTQRQGPVASKAPPAATYFMGGDVTQVRDPQCANVTTAQNLRSLCTLNAVADAKTGQILLQNPLPGKRGNPACVNAEGPGRWRFDANMSKSFKISETKSDPVPSGRD